MKKSLSCLLAIVMLISSLSIGITAFAADVINAEIQVTYHQSEARSMLSLVNNFRKSNDAWCWNENNTSKDKYSGLSNLVYDYDLEKIAMQRAAEIVVKFDHNRPNGEECWSAYPSGSYYACCENIAAGQRTAEEVFTDWREDNEYYNGQGHRRNMLNGIVTSVGIACAEYNGRKYWVQEFRAPTHNTTPTAANDSASNVKINIKNSDIVYSSASASVKRFDLAFGETAELPVVTAEIILADTWPDNMKIKCEISPEWTSANRTVAKIADGKIIAVGEGLASVETEVFGKTISCLVAVKADETACKHDGGYEWIADLMVSKQCSKCGAILLILPFTDLASIDYRQYGDYIEYTSVNNQFITGTNPPVNTAFAPTRAINRAMMVTILYRMAGEPYADYNPYRTSPFMDITDTSAYYYEAACWALKNGITTETTFKPFDNVSREQTASFLFRYAKDNGKLGGSAYKNVNLADYPDYNSVHGWAVEAMQWANYNGMITGTQQGYINPQGATQRIHATKILYGFGKTCNIGNFA